MCIRICLKCTSRLQKCFGTENAEECDLWKNSNICSAVVVMLHPVALQLTSGLSLFHFVFEGELGAAFCLMNWILPGFQLSCWLMADLVMTGVWEHLASFGLLTGQSFDSDIFLSLAQERGM